MLKRQIAVSPGHGFWTSIPWNRWEDALAIRMAKLSTVQGKFAAPGGGRDSNRVRSPLDCCPSRWLRRPSGIQRGDLGRFPEEDNSSVSRPWARILSFWTQCSGSRCDKAVIFKDRAFISSAQSVNHAARDSGQMVRANSRENPVLPRTMPANWTLLKSKREHQWCSGETSGSASESARKRCRVNA